MSLEQTAALADRWLTAFLAGHRADDDVYAERVTTWHNIGEREVEIQQVPSRTRQVVSGADLRVVDPRLHVFDGGWVFQGTTVGTNAAGAPVRVPTCLVATVVDGRIARFEEYADSAAASSLFAAGPDADGAPGGESAPDAAVH
jgi:ketosteroid isomerase-like protein